MALSREAKDWLQKHGLQGFIRVVEAPPHQDPKKVAKSIDVDDISEAIIQATI